MFVCQLSGLHISQSRISVKLCEIVGVITPLTKIFDFAGAQNINSDVMPSYLVSKYLFQLLKYSISEQDEGLLTMVDWIC